MNNISKVLDDSGLNSSSMVSLENFKKIMIQFEQNLKAEHSKNHRFYLIGEMTASLVHDLKNPLNGFSMLAESISWIQQDLEEGLPKEEIINRLKNIETLMTKQVAEYDRRLTGVSTLAKQTEVVKQMPVKDLERLINQSLSMFTSQFQKCDTKMLIEINWSSLSDKTLQMNPAYFTQSISALLKNSLEALAKNQVKDKWIKILIEERDSLIVTVKDSGATEKDQEKYFEKGFSTKLNGMGLGLNVSKNLLDMAGAKLSFDPIQEFTTVNIDIAYG